MICSISPLKRGKYQKLSRVTSLRETELPTQAQPSSRSRGTSASQEEEEIGGRRARLKAGQDGRHR